MPMKYDVRPAEDAKRKGRLTRIARRLLESGPMHMADMLRRMHVPAGELERALRSPEFEEIEAGRYYAGSWLGWRPSFGLARTVRADSNRRKA
jgi:hypothetical protein